MEKMKVSHYIDMLKLAVELPNRYDNHYPYNCMYHNPNGIWSADCWNMLLSVMSGWTPDIPIGGYVNPKNYVTGGSVGGETLLKRCTDRSRDFAKLNTPGAYLYIYTSPHAGAYIGEKEVNGHIVNVIECTAAWQGGIQYSYVDEKGGRYDYKGGHKNKYSWEEYGLLTLYLDYTDSKPEPIPEPTPEPVVEYVDYTVKKGDTLNAIAKKYNTTLSAILAVNPQIKDPNKIYPGQVIKIPIPTQQNSTSAIPKEQVYHTVQRGETLSGIAKKYGTNYLRLATLNHIANPNKIYPGQKLRIR